MKRLVFGLGTSLAVGLLSTTGVFASSLDYAKSVGQVDMADTGNFVIEATSDGGYVVGGQTVQCFKRAWIDATNSLDGNLKPATLMAQPAGGYIRKTVYGEVAPMEECEEYYSHMTVLDSADVSYRGDTKVDSPIVRTAANIRLAEQTDESLFDQYCIDGGAIGRSFGSANALLPNGLAAYDPDADYSYSCVDYIAKFKQDGTKEWLTTIRNGDLPVAVGETTSDYRLVTEFGMLYTFAKAEGDEKTNVALASPKVHDAIINNDGTTTAALDSSITVFNADGSKKKSIAPVLGDDREEFLWVNDTEIAKPFVRIGDSFVAGHAVHEYDEATDEYKTTTYEIVKVSNDLNTISPIFSFDEDDIEVLGDMFPFSADQNGNILVGLEIMTDSDSPDEWESVAASIDKDGNLIGASSFNELFGLDDSFRPTSIDEVPMILDNFTIVVPTLHKMVLLTPQLTEIDSYALAEGEIINDVVVLNDGSLAGVGRSTVSTANYTVDGGVNGTYLRLTAKTSGSGTTNPQTDDEDIKLYVAGGAAIILFAFGLMLRGSKRRAN